MWYIILTNGKEFLRLTYERYETLLDLYRSLVSSHGRMDDE